MQFSYQPFLKVYLTSLFLSVLGLCCCVWAFSSCGTRASHCGGFSCCGEHGLCGGGHGLRCLAACGSPWARDGTCVSCFGRWTLNQWTTREVPRQPTEPLSRGYCIPFSQQHHHIQVGLPLFWDSRGFTDLMAL